MIQKIKIENVKGTTGEIPLDRLNFITGPNFSGKSTIADAIRLCLVGSLPMLAKSAAGIFALSSGPEMAVAVTYDNGNTFRRQWTAAGKTIRATTAGQEMPALAAAIDVAAFIAATPKARIDILRTVQPAGDFDALIAEAEAEEEKAKDHRADVKQWEKTAAGMAEIIASQPAPNPVTPEQVKEAEETVASAKATMDDARRRLRKYEHTAEAAAEAREALEFVTNPPPEPPAVSAEELKKASYEFEKASDELTAATLEENRIRSEFRAFPPTPEPIEPDAIEAMRAEVEKLGIADASPISDPMAEIATQAANVRRIKAELDALPSLEQCPFCECSGEGWKTKLETKYTSALSVAEKILAALREHKVAYDEQAAAIAAKTEAIKRLADAEKSEELRIKSTALMEQLEKAEKNTISRKETAISARDKWRNLSEGREIRTQWEDIKRRFDELTASARAAIESHVDDDESAAALATAVANAEVEYEEAAAALEFIRAAEDEWKTWHRRELDLSRTRELIAEAEGKMAKHADKAKELRQQAKDAMDRLFSRILSIAGPLSSAVMNYPLTMNPFGEIGIAVGGGFRPYGALSGTERAIADACIQAGLSSGGIAIIDELSRADSDRKTRLLSALSELVEAGKLAQVIVIDHDSNACPEGWKMIRPQ